MNNKEGEKQAPDMNTISQILDVKDYTLLPKQKRVEAIINYVLTLPPGATLPEWAGDLLKLASPAAKRRFGPPPITLGSPRFDKFRNTSKK